MALKKVNFTLTTPYLDLQTRDFKVSAGVSLDPALAACLVDGEWMQLDPESPAAPSLIRCKDNPVRANGLVYPVYAEKGRSEIQALKMVPVIYSGSFEFTTTMFAAKDSTDESAHGWKVGQMATVRQSNIFADAEQRSGLVFANTTNDVIVAYCTRADAGKERFFASIGGFGVV